MLIECEAIYEAFREAFGSELPPLAGMSTAELEPFQTMARLLTDRAESNPVISRWKEDAYQQGYDSACEGANADLDERAAALDRREKDLKRQVMSFAAKTALAFDDSIAKLEQAVGG